METWTIPNWSLLTNSRRRYMTEILPVRRETLSNFFCPKLQDIILFIQILSRIGSIS